MISSKSDGNEKTVQCTGCGKTYAGTYVGRGQSTVW